MVSTHLKNISQIGSFPQVGVNINKCLKPPPSYSVIAIVFPWGWAGRGVAIYSMASVIWVQHGIIQDSFIIVHRVTAIGYCFEACTHIAPAKNGDWKKKCPFDVQIFSGASF